MKKLLRQARTNLLAALLVTLLGTSPLVGQCTTLETGCDCIPPRFCASLLQPARAGSVLQLATDCTWTAGAPFGPCVLTPPGGGYLVGSFASRPISLPAELGPGGRSCLLWVEPAGSVWLPYPLRLPIPGSPGVIGMGFVIQEFLQEQPGLVSPFCVSNAGIITVVP